MDGPMIPAHLLAQADQAFAFADEALDAFLHLTAHVAQEGGAAATWWFTLTTFMEATTEGVSVLNGGDRKPALEHIIAITAAACIRLNQLGDYGSDHEECPRP